MLRPSSLLTLLAVRRCHTGTTRGLLHSSFLSIRCLLDSRACYPADWSIAGAGLSPARRAAVVGCTVEEFNLPATLAADLLDHFWGRYHAFCRPFADVVPTLSELRRRGTPLGIITNGTQRVQHGAISALGILTYFGVILISEVEGVRKPDRRIFHKALERLGVDAAECCHVGDHPVADATPAKAAGLAAIWKRTSYWSPPAADIPAIDTLGEVLSYV